MKSKYSFENKEKYLYLRIVGEYSYEDAISYLSLMLEECEKVNKDKLLINMLEIKGADISAVDRFLLGEKIAEIIRKRIKIALAFPEENITKLFETVASNRGADIGVFGNLENAIIWLLK